MKHLLKILLLSLAISAFPAISLAQNADADNNIVINTPDEWKNGDSREISNSRIYIFVHPDSENRIEVFKRALVNDAHAETLFSAFQNQLVSSKFTLISTEKDKIYELNNGKKLSTTCLKYEYIHEEINITVKTVSFIYNHQAYIFVGYLAPIARTNGEEVFDNMIKSLQLSLDD